MAINERWKNASPLVKTLTGIFVFVSAGTAALSAGWNCNTEAVATSNNIKAVPKIQQDVSDIKAWIAADTTRRVWQRKATDKRLDRIEKKLRIANE